MKKAGKIIGIIILSLVLGAGAMYLGIVFFFGSVFDSADKQATEETTSYVDMCKDMKWNLEDDGYGTVYIKSKLTATQNVEYIGFMVKVYDKNNEVIAKDDLCNESQLTSGETRNIKYALIDVTYSQIDHIDIYVSANPVAQNEDWKLLTTITRDNKVSNDNNDAEDVNNTDEVSNKTRKSSSTNDNSNSKLSNSNTLSKKSSSSSKSTKSSTKYVYIKEKESKSDQGNKELDNTNKYDDTNDQDNNESENPTQQPDTGNNDDEGGTTETQQNNDGNIESNSVDGD